MKVKGFSRVILLVAGLTFALAGDSAFAGWGSSGGSSGGSWGSSGGSSEEVLAEAGAFDMFLSIGMVHGVRLEAVAVDLGDHLVELWRLCRSASPNCDENPCKSLSSPCIRFEWRFMGIARIFRR